MGMQARVGISFSVALLLAMLSQRSVPGATLPVPCAPGACGASTTSFVKPAPGASGSPTVTAVQSGNTLTINQSSNNAILNWASFNVSADGKVTFNQPSATSIALNRIFQNTPSAIFGQVSANGQIYLVNPYGFVFGATAQVNAAGLIASTLGISDQVFNAGLLAPQVLSGTFGNKAALSGNIGADGNPLPGGDPNTSAVIVQQGAQISTPGGRLLLAAPNVQNSGTLSAPDGQVVLAGGQNVYLLASTDPSLRGLIVEVDGNNASASNQVTTATNTATGVISAPRGNVWMVGLAVNQDGRVSATTSVSANGSVHLEAASNTSVGGGGGSNSFTLTPLTGGTLELGSQSSIDIQPELSSSATAVPDQVQLPSQIALLGEAIDMHGGSITAPNATLTAIASAAPGSGVQTDGNPLAQIRIDAGTTIDLSGSSVELPMSANLLAIQLRANELADDPAQQNGPLRGQTVYVDARVGSPLINQAAFESALDAVGQSVGQRTETGGSATFESEGDVVLQKGATINVSGGHTTYDSGAFQTTQLVGTNGQLYDIGSANPLMSYSGVLNPTVTQTYNKWGVQSIVPVPGLTNYASGYVQGAPAGTVSIAAPALVLAGTLIGTATNGAQQRGSSAVSGGQLVIGLPGGLGSVTVTGLDFLAPGVEFVTQAAPIIVADGTPLPPQTVQLPTEYLTAGGFTSTKIYSNGIVTVPAGVPLNLNPGGSLFVDAPRIDIDSNITAIDGNITLENVSTVDANVPGIPRLGVDIGSGVTLDVSGQWTNDYATALQGAIGTGQILANGGTITISPGVGAGIGNQQTNLEGSELVLGDNVVLRANGGAWLQSTGQIIGGTGGSISLVGANLDAALQIGAGVQVEAFGAQGASGGTFSLTAPRILIGNGGAAWAAPQRVDDLAPAGGTAPGGVLTLSSSLFDSDGFSSVNLVANGAVPLQAQNSDILTVASGTTITALTQTFELMPSYLMQPTGAPLNGFAQLAILPVGTRPVANISLSVSPTAADASLLNVGLLDVQAGASILADPSASISLSGVGGVYVNGTLSAPGGSIALTTEAPIGTPDPGYLPNLRVELGPQAILDASGAFIPLPNDQNRILGTILGGGTVSLVAGRGSVVTDPGSQIDIEGIDHLLDVATNSSSQTYARYDVGSAGGSLLVRAPESISLLGTLQAQAGQGNYGQPAAGSLEVDLTRSEFFNLPADPELAATFPTTPRVIELVSTLPANPTPSDPGSGQAILGIAQLAASGIDSLRLEAGNEILFDSSTPLTLARQLILDAPAIGVGPGFNASVVTNYAALGNSLPAPSLPAAAAGTGNLTISAQQIDLVGAFVLQNIGTTTLNSAGDITLRDVYFGSLTYGSLGLDGNLALNAARVYPDTATTFSIATTHGPGDSASMIDTVSIGQTSPSPGTPLSAGGSVSISADQITSSGTLVAPFGTINLTAANSLNLEQGSVTSVSGAGMTIPYGATELGGQEWLYTPSGGAQFQVTGTPARAVSLTAPTLNVAAGATVNLQGGGDVYAYEWVPGTGGTTDALGQNPTTGQSTIPGLYAVLPSLLGQFAPYDPQETPLAGLTPGQSIYLSGVTGLAAGIYPLLPARDALVPGAFLVQVQPSGYNYIVPGQQAALQDGTPVIAGYLTFGTTGLHSGGYQGVAVWPGSYGQALAEYSITDASTYFAALASQAGAPPPTLPADAGALSIQVSTALNFLGSVVGNAPNTAGIGSKIDISAPALEVTAAGSSDSTNGAVTILGTVIQSWKAGELILGGQASSDGTSIGVTANSVTVDDGAQVSANQVIIVANQAINVQPGAEVLSTSATTGGTAPPTLPATTVLTLTGPNGAGAAMLAVSDLTLPILDRAGVSAGGATITVGPGSTVGSLGALSLDAPGGAQVSGSLSGTGAAWSLASASIGFVGSGTSNDALQIDSALQSAMTGAASIRLASDGAINLYTPVLLGAGSANASPTLAALTLSANAIVNQGAADGTVFGAKTLTLEGAAGGTAGAPPMAAANGGSLNFVAGELDIGAGTLAINGFQNTSISASSAVVGLGAAAGAGSQAAIIASAVSSGGIVTGGNLSITTPLVTAVSEAQTGLSAPFGTLTISSAGTRPSALTIPNDLGGEVDLQANTLSLSGAIVVPAGIVSAQATQGITLGSSGSIDVSGQTVTIGGKSFGAEGGAVTLNAGADLILAAGSSINVSGAGDAPAGSIALTAAGNADLLAVLSGQGGTGAVGGSFHVEAATLVEGLTPLVESLQTGGFTAADTVIAHTGDLILSPGAALAANQITLVADTGSVEIGGTLTAASASLRGTIGLFGGAGVALDSSAVVSADATGAAGIGGEIDLGTNNGGTIVLASGSVLSAAGATTGGLLLARAPIVGNDVALSNDGAALLGFNQIIVEPIITMPIGNTLSQADLNAIVTTAAQTIGSVTPSIEARLNPNGSLPLIVRGAVDLTQSGSLTLANSLDLYSSSAGGTPLDLSFRIGGSITVGATGGFPTPVSISDGFVATSKGLTLSQMPSSSFRLVAGADSSSPDPLALTTGSGANLTLEPDSIVRTGTGEIDLSASGNIIFSSPGAGGGATPLVYTAGISPLGANGQPIAPIPVAGSTFVFNFPTEGGAIRVDAGGDIQGAAVQQSVAGWQLRQGNSNKPAMWGVDLDELGWNITSLGGGDVAIQAGGSIDQLSAAAADSLYQPKGVASIFTPSGGLQVTAGGDIGSSQFYLAEGTGLLRAGGAFSAIQPVAGTTNAGSVLALSDAQLIVEARTGIVIDAIMNPQANTEVLLASGNQSYFFTYGSQSSVLLQSTGGDVELLDNALHIQALMGSGGNSVSGNLLYPSTLIARSLLDDVSLPLATLFPSPSGQLEVVAGQDVLGNSTIIMSDAALNTVPSAALPATSFSTLTSTTQVPFSANLHIDDPTPALIAAGRDILNVALEIPKATDIIAGRDITDLQFQGENLSPADLTLISAGRDFIDDATGGLSGLVQVGGPGQVDVLAGRNVNLGFSSGITTVGATVNPNLPIATGAALTVMAGLGQATDNYSDFVTKIIAPDPTNQQLLVAYVESLSGQTGLSYASAATEFAALSPDQQRPLINQVFFDQLSISGLQANTEPQLGYSLGYAAIDALFPNSRSAVATGPSPYAGDISLTFSRIYTLSGGGISLLAPGGEVDVGLANAPANLGVQKTPSQLGIVAQGPGDVDIYTLGDVNVNSSRIFTLGGGNILIWSDQGNIDAGRGSKSSVSAPPPEVLVDSSGNITLSFSGAVAGSGIRTIQVFPDVNPGDVNLVAPAGTVNAGDAGIGAAGNINIAAEHVVGLDNINFGGTATGVPAQVSNIGVTLAGAAGTASSASNASTAAVASNSEKEASASLASNALSWLDVFVTGLGEEGCKQDDMECLKRQKTVKP
jgi:filamentous hemagglutinin